MEITNSDLACVFDLERGNFSFLHNDEHFPALYDACLSISYICGNKLISSPLKGWSNQSSYKSTLNFQGWGEVKRMDFIGETEDRRLSYHLTFAMEERQPLLFWRLEVTNQFEQPIYIRRIELLRIDESSENNARVQLEGGLSEAAFFSHGWQSW